VNCDPPVSVVERLGIIGRTQPMRLSEHQLEGELDGAWSAELIEWA
jgi:hypothetical protein